jgi:hypothetical protein
MNPELQAELRSELIRTLLQIALQDLVAIVRHAVDMNSTPSGTPTLTFEGPAIALERFDRLGGFDALCLELWRSSPSVDAVLQSRTASDGIGQVAKPALSGMEGAGPPDTSVAVGNGRHRSAGAWPAGRTA